MYTGLGLLDLTDTVMLPAPARDETRITGYPEGFWLNYVTWSKDSRHIAFAVRSPGVACSCFCSVPPIDEAVKLIRGCVGCLLIWGCS